MLTSVLVSIIYPKSQLCLQLQQHMVQPAAQLRPFPTL